jgi:hypothetical protein
MAKSNIFSRVAKAVSSAPPSSPCAGAHAIQHVYVHPCVINQQPHIVYPKGLQQTAPEIFQQVKTYYTALGYALKEDQREADTGRPRHKDRRRWAPVVLFTASLLLEAGAHAEVENEHMQLATAQQIEVRLVPQAPADARFTQHIDSLQNSHHEISTTLKSGIARNIFSILHQHYHRQKTDPAYVETDLKQIANYYSDFPEIVTLLESLSDKNWEMMYDAESWDTVASGNALRIEKAVVHFDSRSAAQLLLNRKCSENPVCIASPADALLHELLHTHSMLVDTTRFISQGGMNSVLYPYQHEYAVIDAERKLYASMTSRDDIKRPQRTDHTGRAVITHCPICIK